MDDSDESDDKPFKSVSKKKSKFADTSDENESSGDKEGGSTDSFDIDDSPSKQKKFQRKGNQSLPMILVGTKSDEFEHLTDQFNNLSIIEVSNR